MQNMNYGQTRLQQVAILGDRPQGLVDPCHAPRLNTLGVNLDQMAWPTERTIVWRCVGEKCLPADVDLGTQIWLKSEGHMPGDNPECAYLIHFPFALVLTPTEKPPTLTGKGKLIGSIGVDSATIGLFTAKALSRLKGSERETFLDAIIDNIGTSRDITLPNKQGYVSMTLEGDGYYRVWRYPENTLVIDLGNAKALKDVASLHPKEIKHD